MARQLTIEGTEGPNIPALNLAAEKYATLMEKAEAAKRDVGMAEVDLLAAMRAAKVKVYRDNEAVPPLIIRLTESTKEKLKVQAASIPVEKPIPGVAIMEPRGKTPDDIMSHHDAADFSKVPPPKIEPEAKPKAKGKSKSKGKGK